MRGEWTSEILPEPETQDTEQSRGPVTDWGTWYGQHLTFERQSGEEWDAFCPFHDDGERASFRVNVAKGVWFCNHEKAGGSARQFAERLGVDPPSGNGGRPRTRIVATYDYRDEQGRLLFQVVRTEPKGFFQRRPDGKGGWIKGLGNVRRVLYYLPELLRGPDPILVTEGEEDAKRLRALGFNSTTNPMGAGKWDPQYAESLGGRRVVLLPDNDHDGRAHMQQVAGSLVGVAAAVRWLALDGLPPKGDVSDWLDAGGTAADLRLLAADSPEPPAEEAAAAAPRGRETFHLTDLGNAKRLVAHHGQDLRYCHPWKRWLTWDAVRWCPDKTGAVQALAKDTVLGIYEEARAEPDPDRRPALAKHAAKSEADARITAMLSLAESEPGIPVLPDALDADPWLLNCENGTLDLRTGQLRPHDRADLITKVIPVAYDPAATCLTWETFLDRIMAENPNLIGFLQRTVGSALTGDASDQVIFILYGTGANGKSAFLKVVAALLGEYALWTPAETFLLWRAEAIRNDLARLRGVRFVASTETEEGAKLAEGIVKRTTGDTITARFLHQEYFDFPPTHKAFLAVNHRPTIKGTDHAIWRRIRLIPFIVTIPDEEQDPWLPDRLREELPGILNWALAGCREWQERGLNTPEEVRTATQGYRSDMDVLGAFVEECCTVGDTLSVTAKDLYKAYADWAKDAGERTMTKKSFGTRLGEKGFSRRRTNRGHTWYGVALRTGMEPESEEDAGDAAIAAAEAAAEARADRAGG